MLQAALADGTAHRRCVFEVFTRRLPAGPAVRRCWPGPVGCSRRSPRFRFGAAELDWLADERRGRRRDARRTWPDYRFTGSVVGYAEGEAFFPSSPVMVVEGTFAEAVLLETRRAVDPQLRLGGRVRRVPHDQRGGRPARAWRWGRGARTRRRRSRRPGRPWSPASRARRTWRPGAGTGWRRSARRRTRSRSCTTTRRPRSRRRSRRWAPGTTLLVDTYDVRRGVELALAAAGTGLGAVRLDSGDLGVLAHEVRAQLDEAGAAEHEDHGHVGPRRVRDRVARGRARRLLRGRHVGGHRVRGADVRDGLQAGRPRGRRRGARRRWRRPPAAKISVGRPQGGGAAAGRPTGGRSRRCWSRVPTTTSGGWVSDDASLRALHVPAGHRRGGRPAAGSGADGRAPGSRTAPRLARRAAARGATAVGRRGSGADRGAAARGLRGPSRSAGTAVCGVEYTRERPRPTSPRIRLTTSTATPIQMRNWPMLVATPRMSEDDTDDDEDEPARHG